MALIAPLDPLSFNLTPAGSGGPVTPESLQKQQLADAQTQQAQAQQLHAQAEAAAKAQATQRQQALQAAISAAGRNPTSAAYTEIMTAFPEFAEKMKPGMEQLTQKDKDTFAGQALPAFNALSRGRADLGIPYLERLVRAHENAGQPEKAERIRALIETAREDPFRANGELGALYGMVVGKDALDAAVTSMNLPKTQEKLGYDTRESKAKAEEGETQAGLLLKYGAKKDQAAIDKDTSQAVQNRSSAAEADARTKTIKDEAAASLQIKQGEALEHKYKGEHAEEIQQLEKDRVAALKKNADTAAKTEERMAGKLPADARTELGKLTANIRKSDILQSRALNLAARFDNISGMASSGKLAEAAEAIKYITGNQDWITRTRQIHNELTNSKAAELLKELKPASDSDAALAFKPLPPDSTDAKVLAKYHREQARILAEQVKLDTAQKEYMSQNGGSTGTNTTKTFKVMGVEVKPGDTLEQVYRKLVEQLSPEEERELAAFEAAEKKKGKK